MATYEYQCAEGHTLERKFDMGSAPASINCGCGANAARVYTSPMVPLMDYRAKVGRKRRPNPGDDMYVPHDAEAARIARTF